MKVSLELTKSPSFGMALGKTQAAQNKDNVYTNNGSANLNLMPNSTKASLITFKGTVDMKKAMEQKDREIAKAIIQEGAGYVISAMAGMERYDDLTLIQASDSFTEFDAYSSGDYKKFCHLLGNYDLWLYDESDDVVMQTQITKDRFKNIISLLEEESKELKDVNQLASIGLNPKDKRIKKAFDVYKEKGYRALRNSLAENFAKDSGFYNAVNNASEDLNPELMKEEPKSIYQSIRKRAASVQEALNPKNEQRTIDDLRYVTDIMFEYGHLVLNDNEISFREFAGLRPKSYQKPAIDPDAQYYKIHYEEEKYLTDAFGRPIVDLTQYT